MTDSDRNLKRDRVLFAIVAIYLVITFVRRLFPASETPGPAVSMLTILFELALAVGLIGLGVRILKAIPPATPGRGKWLGLFVAGLLSLFGIFMVHLVGGPRVKLPPRSTSFETTLPSANEPNLERAPKQEADSEDIAVRFHRTMKLKSLIAIHNERYEEIKQTRWAQIMETNDPEQRRMLTRDDLREFLQKLRRFYQTLDEGVDVFAEAKSKGWSFREFVDDPRSDPEALRLARALLDASDKHHTLLETNWEEFRAVGVNPVEGHAKPWQEEATRLDAEMKALTQELKKVYQKN